MQVAVMQRLGEDASPLGLPVSSTTVPAGFPSPAQDYFEGRIDLNKHLILL